MVKMNLLVAYRSMIRNKFYAFINIFGLGLGLAVSILIGIFVKDELSYDLHWDNHDRIVRISSDIKFQDNIYKMANSPAPMAKAFKEDFPEIEVAGRFRGIGQEVINIDDKYFTQDRITFADQDMLKIFKLDLVSGSFENALTNPNSSIINESTALKLFGSSDVAGKAFKLKDKSININAVYRDIPANSHFHFNVILSMEDDPISNDGIWLSNNFKTYFLLDEGASYQTLQSKFSGVYERYFGPQLQQFTGASWDQLTGSGSYVNYYLIQLKDIHLRSNLSYEIEANGNIQYIYILMAAGLFVLIIASINFMNISTARSSMRAKEVGMRKVMGGLKRQLVFQFIVESLLNAFLALIFAVVLTFLLLPLFNELTGKEIINPYFGELWIWPEVLTLSLFIGLLAGLYPAFYLSGFIPIKVLKGELSLGLKSGRLRNLLVIIQFTASVLLIFGSIVIFSQLQFTQKKSLGFNKDQVLIINETQTLGKSIESFKEELLSFPPISSVTSTGYLPTSGYRSDSPLQPKAATSTDDAVGMQQWGVDESYIPTLELKLIAGRNFSKEFATDSSAIILNETAVRRFGFKDPVGQKLKNLGDFDMFGIKEFEVVGVIEDFHFDDFKNQIVPLGLLNLPNIDKMAIRYDAGKTREVMDYTETKWKAFNPALPIQFEFMDQQYAAKYRSEEKLSSLFGSFAVLSILIACLGLFGLAAFTSDQKKKEIGVRKVLGATIGQLMIDQLKGYTRLLIVALFIGLPVGHYLMSDWLSNFAYRVNITWIIYLLPVILILLLAWATVSFISYRASVQNPADNLHTE